MTDKHGQIRDPHIPGVCLANAREKFLPDLINGMSRTVPKRNGSFHSYLLAMLESIFLTEWNEGSGEDVELFWKRVAERGLPFQRRDVVREVLARGRINSETEYQTITDGIVIQQQMGRISATEADKLGRMLGQFEQRASKRHAR